MWNLIKYRIEHMARIRREVGRFGENPSWLSEDKRLRAAYRFRNPYAICRHFQQKRGIRKWQPFGETPLEVAQQIGEAFELKEGDTLYDLGAGRGRALLFWRHFFHCQAIGIEENPTFAQIATDQGIEMLSCDYIEADLSNATHLYLYGTTLCGEEIKALSWKLQILPKRPQIATVSYALSHYCGDFEVLKRLKAKFPWGETDIFIQRKTNG